ncbi:alpha/beta hydrolase [Thermoactinospora rubra]|uniref:alpha/beta hydrolase n=1 Tax=Thermoactinospora rubra TaxID=1088767 RepID=UPI00197FDB8D|nr:alpha/beta hydrolase [Thermoactinospora rubra]
MAVPGNAYPPELSRFTVPGGGVRVPYGEEPDQYGELWLPRAGTPPHPVVVLVHGGFWRSRYRLDLMHALAHDLATAGFAAWNLEYRRVGDPGGGLPGTFADVAAGLEALAELAAAYPLDLARVGVVGHSAGGHLAAWLPARTRTPWGAGGKVRLRVVVGLAPVADLRLAHAWRLSDDAAAELVGATAEEAPELYRLASPAELLPLGVRQILVHGTADDSVPYEMSVRYHRAARAAGDDCELIGLPGAGHFEVIDPGSQAWATTRRRLAQALG